MQLDNNSSWVSSLGEIYTRTRLGRFIKFYVKIAKMTLIQGQWPLFQIAVDNIPGCMFGANLVILEEICDELWRRQSKFPRILCQVTKWYWRSRSMTSIFNTSPVSQYARLVLIWWFKLKSSTNYRVDKLKFAGGRTVRQTDRRRLNNTPSVWKAKEQ